VGTNIQTSDIINLCYFLSVCNFKNNHNLQLFPSIVFIVFRKFGLFFEWFNHLLKMSNNETESINWLTHIISINAYIHIIDISSCRFYQFLLLHVSLTGVAAAQIHSRHFLKIIYPLIKVYSQECSLRRVYLEDIFWKTATSQKTNKQWRAQVRSQLPSSNITTRRWMQILTPSLVFMYVLLSNNIFRCA
jgi:hypothetical protein